MTVNQLLDYLKMVTKKNPEILDISVILGIPCQTEHDFFVCHPQELHVASRDDKLMHLMITLEPYEDLKKEIEYQNATLN